MRYARDYSHIFAVDFSLPTGTTRRLSPLGTALGWYMDYTDVRRGWVHRMIPPGGSSTDTVLTKWEEAHVAPDKPRHWYLPGNSSIGVVLHPLTPCSLRLLA